MEENATKAIVIGTSIFVTMLIVSLVFVSFNQMKDIFSLVQDTDTSIHSELDNYVEKYILAYDGKVLTGMDLLNLLKIVEDEQDVVVNVDYDGKNSVKAKANSEGIRETQMLKELMENNKKLDGVIYKYETQYNVTSKENGNVITIEFNSK